MPPRRSRPNTPASRRRLLRQRRASRSPSKAAGLRVLGPLPAPAARRSLFALPPRVTTSVPQRSRTKSAAQSRPPPSKYIVAARARPRIPENPFCADVKVTCGSSSALSCFSWIISLRNSRLTLDSRAPEDSRLQPSYDREPPVSFVLRPASPMKAQGDNL